jgi:DNA-binding transcriptional LysR family regulator
VPRQSAPDDPLSIRQLEVFSALVEHGSFTAAARRLGLSQSTVSGHMADLERRLGLRLVERDRSGVDLTAAGRSLLPPAREALAAERRTRQVAAEINGLVTGLVVVGGSTIPSVHLLPAWMGAFHGRHPGVSLRLLTGDSSEIVGYVAEGRVDVGVVGLEVGERGLVSAPVGTDELVLVLPPDHALAGRTAVPIRDVAALPMVLREPGSGTRKTALDAFAAAGLEGKVQVACEVGSTEAVKAAVRAGLGVSFVSSLAVRDEVAAGHLVTVGVEGVQIRRSFHIVSRDDTRMSPAARAFRDEVRALAFGG